MFFFLNVICIHKSRYFYRHIRSQYNPLYTASSETFRMSRGADILLWNWCCIEQHTVPVMRATCYERWHV